MLGVGIGSFEKVRTQATREQASCRRKPQSMALLMLPERVYALPDLLIVTSVGIALPRDKQWFLVQAFVIPIDMFIHGLFESESFITSVPFTDEWMCQLRLLAGLLLFQTQSLMNFHLFTGERRISLA